MVGRPSRGDRCGVRPRDPVHAASGRSRVGQLPLKSSIEAVRVAERCAMHELDDCGERSQVFAFDQETRRCCSAQAVCRRSTATTSRPVRWSTTSSIVARRPSGERAPMARHTRRSAAAHRRSTSTTPRPVTALPRWTMGGVRHRDRRGGPPAGAPVPDLIRGSPAERSTRTRPTASVSNGAMSRRFTSWRHRRSVIGSTSTGSPTRSKPIGRVGGLEMTTAFPPGNRRRVGGKRSARTEPGRAGQLCDTPSLWWSVWRSLGLSSGCRPSLRCVRTRRRRPI